MHVCLCCSPQSDCRCVAAVTIQVVVDVTFVTQKRRNQLLGSTSLLKEWDRDTRQVHVQGAESRLNTATATITLGGSSSSSTSSSGTSTGVSTVVVAAVGSVVALLVIGVAYKLGERAQKDKDLEAQQESVQIQKPSQLLSSSTASLQL